MDTMTWEIREEGYCCPHCEVEGFEAVFWLCCDKAKREYDKMITGPWPPGYVVLPISLRDLVDEVDWLSLRQEQDV